MGNKKTGLGGSLRKEDLVPSNFIEQMVTALESGQEFDAFEAALFKQMNIETDEPPGALEKLERELRAEVRAAWNQEIERLRGSDKSSAGGAIGQRRKKVSTTKNRSK